MEIKYCVDIKYISAKDKNEKDLKEYIEKHDNVFSFVWVNKDFSTLLNGRYFSNMKEIKRIYPGQSYIFYPIVKVEKEDINTFMIVPDDVSDVIPDGYVVVSKRGFRTEYAHLKYDKLSVLKNEIDRKITEYINDINLFQDKYVWECTLTDAKTEKVLDVIIVRITEEDEIGEYVINHTKVLDANSQNILFSNGK